MKIPLHWLKEYVDIDISVNELTDKLTSIGHMQDKRPEQVENDTVIDLEVRQNRPDCLSVLGVAREVAAVTGKLVTAPSAQYPSTALRTSAVQSTNGKDKLHIENDAPDLCRRFNAYRIKLPQKNSKLSTPQWMVDRLTAYGIKLISPIVDITNYVTIELGEPLHAFDMRFIEDGEVVVRRAHEGEKLTILGGKALTLTNDDLVVASKSNALSLAGMIGGADSGVGPDTTEIVLEAATYNQASIRRSSIRHSVRTEASSRHEKFLHPQLAEVALGRAAQLVLDICKGEIVSKADSYPKSESTPKILLRISEIARLGGVSISADDASGYLKSLGFSILNAELLALEVSVPYWRTDILYEADLVEEVVRLYGYERIPMVIPAFAPPKNITSYWFTLEEEIRDIMLAHSFDEHITEPLTKSDGDTRQVVLQNALNSQKDALRLTLQEGSRHALSHQKKFGREEARLFELGKVYEKTDDPKSPYTERRQLAFIVHNAHAPTQEVYLRAKGVVDSLCTKLGYTPTDNLYQIDVLDKNSVYVALEIERYWGPETPRVKADKRLYTVIPHLHTFDISLYLPKAHQPGAVIQTVKDGWKEVENIDYELFQPKDANMVGLLLKCTVSGATHKHVLIEAIAETLKQTYSAIIR